MLKRRRFLKNLVERFEHIRKIYNNSIYTEIDLACQDESRFGLMTKQKKVLVSQGVEPIGKFQHTYKQVWLWGIFSIITGKSFYWETPIVNNLIFEDYLKAYASIEPKTLTIMLIDNAGFHATKNIQIPNNIILLRIPPYTPELNPAEKVWQWMKSKTSMKFFKNLNNLQNKITELVHTLNKEKVKSIVNWELYQNPFSAVFKT